jgi:hypothetical protein
MTMRTVFAIRVSSHSSRVRRNDSQCGKCKDLSVFSHPLTLCRKSPCTIAFLLLAGGMLEPQVEAAVAGDRVGAYTEAPDEFGGLDIDQLSRVRVISSTLTPTSISLIPAKTTKLDKSVIAKSGARAPNELLDIYTLNKRAYYFRGSDCSVEVAAVAFSARLKF